ncbi:MAG TPA: MarR family transcriptional regulator [Rhizobiales bacterium]|nr:MarR family transcriptional regulator [Hyphomicrobiales bacterium]
MSTNGTRSPRAGLVMVDSQTLRLSQAIARYQIRQVVWLIEGLAARGFVDLTPAHVAFVSVLDCADNFASEVARRLNLSRQAVHKTVRELSALGYIETVENKAKRNSRIIQITEHGEELIAQARQMYAELDREMQAKLGASEIDKIIAFLDEEAEEKG